MYTTLTQQNYYLLFLSFVCTFGCVGGVVLWSEVYPLSTDEEWVWVSAPLLSRFALSLPLSPTGCFVFAPPPHPPAAFNY